MKKFLILALTIVLVMGLALGMSACTEQKLIGFDTELAEAVAEDLGLKVKFQVVNWDTKEMEMNSKTVDVVWNGLSMLPGRLSLYEFSKPYMDNAQVVVIRKADQSKYTTVESLATANLVAEKGSTAEEFIKAAPLFASSQYKSANTQMASFTEIASGASDVSIVDSVMAYSSIESNASFKEKLMIVESIDLVAYGEPLNLKDANDEDIVLFAPYGIGMRKDSKGLQDKINVSLAKMWANGTIERLAEKYGLTDVLNEEGKDYTSVYDTLTSEEKADWEYIKNKGTLIVGYTIFPPIAYYE